MLFCSADLLAAADSVTCMVACLFLYKQLMSGGFHIRASSTALGALCYQLTGSLALLPTNWLTGFGIAGLEPTREMDDWFRSLDNLSRSVGVFQQANSVSLPNDSQSRSGTDDWAIGAGSAGGSARSSRGSSGGAAGVKAAKGVGK